MNQVTWYQLMESAWYPSDFHILLQTVFARVSKKPCKSGLGSRKGACKLGLLSAFTRWEIPRTHATVGVQPGFVFFAPHAGAARQPGRVGAWPFWAVRRSSEFGELSSLWLSTKDRQSIPIQIGNNTQITAILHCRTSATWRTAHTGTCKGAGATHCTEPGRKTHLYHSKTKWNACKLAKLMIGQLVLGPWKRFRQTPQEAALLIADSYRWWHRTERQTPCTSEASQQAQLLLPLTLPQTPRNPLDPAHKQQWYVSSRNTV